MSYKVLFVLNAFVAVVVGIAFLSVPEMILLQLGVFEQYAATMWASRFFGSAMLALGLVLWFAKDTEERIQKGMSWGMFVSTLVGLILTIFASLSATAVLRQNTWIPLVLYVLFGLGYGFMLFLKPKMKE
jgi:CHASE2 domain-containing sensor protein